MSNDKYTIFPCLLRMSVFFCVQTSTQVLHFPYPSRSQQQAIYSFFLDVSELLSSSQSGSLSTHSLNPIRDKVRSIADVPEVFRMAVDHCSRSFFEACRQSYSELHNFSSEVPSAVSHSVSADLSDCSTPTINADDFDAMDWAHACVSLLALNAFAVKSSGAHPEMPNTEAMENVSYRRLKAHFTCIPDDESMKLPLSLSQRYFLSGRERGNNYKILH